MIDVVCAREGLKRNEISEIGCIKLEHNLADGLTKQMNQAKIQNLLTTRKLSIKVEQWIERGGSSSDFPPT